MGILGLPIPNPLDILPSRQERKAKEALPSAVPNVVENKVTAGATGAGAGAVLAELVRPLVERLPLSPLVKRLVLLALPIVTSFVAGWLAPHTARVPVK